MPMHSAIMLIIRRFVKITNTDEYYSSTTFNHVCMSDADSRAIEARRREGADREEKQARMMQAFRRIRPTAKAVSTSTARLSARRHRPAAATRCTSATPRAPTLWE